MHIQSKASAILMKTPMKTSRRAVLQPTASGVAALGTWSSVGFAADRANSAAPKNYLVKPPRMKVGTVTYNLAKDWDIDTIIKNCEEAQFQGVELRTSHAHKVEVDLTKAQREDVKKRFQDSKVELMGLGSAFDYHTPDQAKLKKDIAATKEYIILAHDVGARGVKVRPNGLPKEVAKEKTLEQIGKSLRELGDFGENYGVQIRLEVHGTGTSLLPNIKSIIDAANHKSVGVCWNSNQTDLDGDGFDHNFNLVKRKIFSVHMRDLFLDEYSFRKLMTLLIDTGFTGYYLAVIME